MEWVTRTSGFEVCGSYLVFTHTTPRPIPTAWSNDLRAADLKTGGPRYLE